MHGFRVTALEKKIYRPVQYFNRFVFKRVQTRSLKSESLPNSEQNRRSGSGQHPNPNPNLAFGPVRFRFGPRFRTGLSHHYGHQQPCNSGREQDVNTMVVKTSTM
jgi:hypothetical protein